MAYDSISSGFHQINSMARNSEKAQTTLARWLRMKEREERGPVAKRPQDVRECKNLDDAERFRRELISDISKKIVAIQNPGLGEFKIRELNDEINKMVQNWHRKNWTKKGREVAGNRGYKYFGAAKDLPGVRELFEQQAKEGGPPRRSRADLTKNLDAHYYGYLIHLLLFL
ncbi:hypothetical protein M3Y97_00097400 [Aphelenchoides bicaudatus]|nr:hypothetical protein M3Y97_00097400 [Aphelenchoides bicaudatus]